MKIRSLAVLPILALGCLSIAGCDSKAGSAAVVNGSKISESQLVSYISTGAKPIAASDGSSAPARNFVLQFLIRNQLFALLLADAGAPVTDAQLDASRSAALGGGSEADLNSQIAAVGLKPKFEAVVLRNRELLTLVQANKKLSGSEAALTSAVAKLKDKVSISPRYGSWDPSALAVVDLSKKQLPSMLTLDTTLPGDVKAPTGQ